jgi:hypothetical protein
MPYQPGFYWVHWKDNWRNEWMVAEYFHQAWYVTGDSNRYEQSDFYEIGPRIEKV